MCQDGVCGHQKFRTTKGVSSINGNCGDMTNFTFGRKGQDQNRNGL